MEIRLAGPDDKEAIAEVHAASIKSVCSSHYDSSQIESWVNVIKPDVYDQALNEKYFILAVEGRAVTGLGIMDIQGGEISAVYAAPGSIGQGVGTLLLENMEMKAAEKGVRRLTANATLNAQSFYQRKGYRVVGEERHRLPDGTELPCIRMVKTIDNNG